MTIIDRYCAREFLRHLAIIVLSFVCLYLLIDFFERIRMFLSNKASLVQMSSFFLFSIPMVFWQMLPASVLLAAFISFGTLSRQNEIIAMKACGISLYRIAWPIIVIATFISAVAFITSEFITPYTNQKAKYIKMVEIQKTKPISAFKENQIWYRAANEIYNIKVFDPRTNHLWGITIYYVNNKMRLLKRADAERGEWKNGKWILYNLVYSSFTEGKFPILKFRPSQAAMLPVEPDNLTAGQKDAEDMGYMELQRYISDMRSNGYDATNYLVDLYGKVAFPLANIILAIIGLAASLQGTGSSKKTHGLAAGIVIGFSYWIVFAFMISLGRAGVLPPLLAAWSANILFSTAACFLFFRVRT